MKVLVAICCLFFTQQVFAQHAFPREPTAKELYELIDDGKVLGTFNSTYGDYQGTTASMTVVLHPKYGLVTCWQYDQNTRCASGKK
jgi:hypothetical protein